jgi:hypothetical protein
MALDYKTLQAMAASRPANAMAFCPECGRPWRAPSPEGPHPEAAFPWRAAFLALVGLALALAFGVRAARADQRQRAIQRDLAVLTVCFGGGAAGDPLCPTVQDAEGWRRRDDVDAAAARGQRDRALVATALGLLVAGVGLRALARRRRRHDHPPSAIATVGSSGESLIALTCLQVLALTGYSIAVQLSRGLPLTWERLDAAADDVLVLVALLTGSPF